MKYFDIDKFRNLFIEEGCKPGKPVEKIDSGKNGQLLQRITALDHHDDFYTIVDLRQYQIVWEFNLEKQLGCKLLDNKAGFINKMVHPLLREWHLIFAGGMFYGILNNALINKGNMKSRYVIHIPIRKQNGKYMLVKQISMPFQFDVHGSMVSYINCFSIIEEYKGQPLNPRILFGNKKDRHENRCLTEFSNKFLILSRKDNLTPSLFRIIKEILRIKRYEKGRLNELIHLRLERKYPEEKIISMKSVADYNLRIKQKLLPLFNFDEIYTSGYSHSEEKNNLLTCLPNLNDVYDLVHFAKGCGVLDILVCEYNRDHAAAISL